ncbi:tRNA adenosine(34) deaminase TadA [Pleionea sp. CnH1-48]|uniref:tRNA adenosine(34) deaminase TadA n=1 Tax=Pleionea sp. CnH1-48 TaxID=2954494 RepID=UPI002097C8D4|nr:tRNA adenosine(34) deaminase TadA [Pleionea sp. CnH1-48]MCO7227450.1 tRNA adenosine(34) deaminase TadA [Pleionea sp. CnH1-48]
MSNQFDERDEFYMHKAIEMARHAESKGEVPVGAILVGDDEIIATGYNQLITTHDPTAHAEIIAIRQGASKVKNYRLINTTLYVTLEPCAMCAMAIVHARIQRVCFGAFDHKTGASSSVFQILQNPANNHQPEVSSGILEQDCSNLLSSFFKRRRLEKKLNKTNI